MTPERANAYRRVLKTLDDLGPSKLLESEQDRIRHAADSLIFSEGLAEDPVAREALGDVELLCRSLRESGRWEDITARRLLDDVAQCGPALEPALQAAA